MKNKKILTVLALMTVVGSMSISSVSVSAEVIGNNSGATVTTQANDVSPEYVYNIIKSSLASIDKDTAKKIAVELMTTNISLTKENIVAYAQNYTIGSSGESIVTTASSNSTTIVSNSETSATTVSAAMRTVEFPSFNAVIGYTEDGKFFGEWKDQSVFGSVKGTWSAKSINGTLTVGNDSFTIKGSYDDNYKVEVTVNGFVLTGYIDKNLSVAVLTPATNQSFSVVPNEVAIATETTVSESKAGTETTVSKEKDAPSTSDKTLGSLGVLSGVAVATALITKKKK